MARFLGQERSLPAALAALLALVLLFSAPARADDADRGVLANLISSALSSPNMNVSIGAVDGALSSDSTIRDVVLSDRDGPWLKIDKARLIWSRLALLRRRLEVDQLTIGHIELLRRPLPSDAPPPDPGTTPSILPELPIKIVIKQFAIDELSLGEPVVGVAAKLTMNGKATLGPPSEGLDLALAGRRLDAGGQFKAILSYVPATDHLTVSINSEEPAGGLFAHIANLPGLPPAKFSFDGAGPLDAFSAKLDFAAGADVWARGGVVVARQGPGRRLTLNLDSRLEGMTPPFLRPVLAGETTLRGDVLFNDDSSVATPGLHLVSANARLDVEGGKSADGKLDVRVHAGAIPGSADIGKLDLNATIAGPVAAPIIEADFDAGAIRTPAGSLERATASFHAQPSGALTEADTRILFEGQGDVKGLAPADPALKRAIGGALTLTARGSVLPRGGIVFDALDIAAADFDARYAGVLGSRKMRGRLDVAAADLNRFAGLAGGKLAGKARVAAELEGAPGYGLIRATLDAKAEKLATPWPILDRATGGELVVTGTARTTAGGGFGFSDFKVVGRNATARLDGDYRKDKADLNVALDIPQAKAVDPRVEGKVALVARLSGKPDDLGADLKATLGAGRLMDRKTTGVALTAEAAHILGPLEARAALTGDIDGQKLAGAAHVGKRAGGGFAIDDLGLSLASARLAGALTLDADGLADGELTFAAKALDDLSPLALTKLGGALQAKIVASSAGGRQTVAVVADSAKLSVGDTRLDGLKADVTVADLWGARTIEGAAKLARGDIAGQSIASLRLTATAGADYSDLDVSGVARGLNVKARGRLFGGSPMRLDLASFSAEGGRHRIALARPATLAYGDDGLDLKDVTLAVDSGRLTISGRAGKRLDLKATANALPLAAADLVAPGLGLTGTADGEATIGGTMDDPTGDWRLRLAKVGAARLRANGLPALDVSGSGRLAGGRTTVDASVNAGAGNAVRVTGSAPISADGALDLRIDGRLDAGLANVALSAGGRHVGGAATVALQLRGTIAKPDARGTISLAGGVVRDDQTGFKLSGVSALITANGDTIRIDRLAGTTPNGGTLGVSGSVRLDPAGGFPGVLKVVGAHALLVDNDIVATTADLSIDVTGKLAERPAISGRITILSMDVTVPNRLGGVSSPIPGTKHLNPTATARALLAQRARAAAGRSGPAFDATLALTISATNRVFVRGRGLNAEFGGDLRVAGSALNPQVTGGFDLLRGSLGLLGQRLTFTRGRIGFHGGTMPELDLVAETSAGDVTARISVTGPADQPTFTISSSPSLPEDEILARILFQKSSGNLSAFQALELANAVAVLSGKGDALDQLRRGLGLSALSLGADSSGGGLLGIGRTINDRIGVNVTTGVRPRDNGVNVNLDVTRHIRLEAGVDATGGTNVGVGAEWEYK